MTTQRIAVTGTDGSGKTTVVRALAAAFADRPDVLRAFRAPQYHEDPELPFAGMSAAIDALSELADREKDPLLKTAALFLSMTLYGDVERHAAQSYRPRFLIAERQCVADSLVYARFYQPLIRSGLDRARLEPKIEAALAGQPGAFERLTAWLRVVEKRVPALGTTDFWELPMYVKRLFTAEPAELVARLCAVYHAEVPDQIVLLTVSPEALAERLAAKRQEAAPQELHEQAHVLAMFQAGLKESCALLKQINPHLIVHDMDTSMLNAETTGKAVLSAIGAPESQA